MWPLKQWYMIYHGPNVSLSIRSSHSCNDLVEMVAFIIKQSLLDANDLSEILKGWPLTRC